MVSFVCEAATTGPRCDTPQTGGARGIPLAERLRGRERRKIDGDAEGGEPPPWRPELFLRCRGSARISRRTAVGFADRGTMYFVAVLRRNRIQIGSERKAGPAGLMLCGLRRFNAEHLRGSLKPNRRTRGMRAALRKARKKNRSRSVRSCPSRATRASPLPGGGGVLARSLSAGLPPFLFLLCHVGSNMLPR
jgi:hypothetical protein